jgi:putative drug exporter of the RND superfamily
VFIGAVLVLSFLLLLVVFRSPLVVLKAVVMNVVSIGAAYGVVVAVFQWGWGRACSAWTARAQSRPGFP